MSQLLPVSVENIPDHPPLIGVAGEKLFADLVPGQVLAEDVPRDDRIIGIPDVSATETICLPRRSP